MYDVASFPESSWVRLGDAVRRRRVALRFTQDQLAAEAECSVNTIRNLEKGKRVRELTLPPIEEALGWEPGSYILVLEGGSPVVAATEDEPFDDALRLERPEGISDADWAAITEKLMADMQFWLRNRRRD